MSRIDDAFARCRSESRAALVGYLTGHDPDRDGSMERLEAACDAGLDLLELGVPFSDPTADGGEIQLAMRRALASGGSLDAVLEIAAALRSRRETPMVLFSYANPLVSRREGIGATVDRIAAAGFDGLLVVDMPPESASPLRDPARAAGLDWIGLCAPTTTASRLARIVAASTGFLYAVSLTGVTGAALDVGAPALTAQLGRIRAASSLPVAVGFGVRTPAQAATLAAHAEGVVVGSALVAAGREGPDALGAAVAGLAAGLREAAAQGSPRGEAKSATQ